MTSFYMGGSSCVDRPFLMASAFIYTKCQKLTFIEAVDTSAIIPKGNVFLTITISKSKEKR